MNLKSVDINCDLGESYGRNFYAIDEALMPYISSCNIACGFHSGDPQTLVRTLRLARDNQKCIGAHISYPDLMGFGRHSMIIPPEPFDAMILYQLSAISGITKYIGTELHHVKLHGALYNDTNQSLALSQRVVNILKKWPTDLALYCPAHSQLYQLAQSEGIRVLAEVFIDRKYAASGALVPRSRGSEALNSIDQAIEQLTSLLQHQSVTTIDGTIIPMTVDTLCIHGDHASSIDLAKKVHETLSSLNISLQSPCNQ